MRACAPTASEDVIREIAGQAAAGALCFLFLCALALVTDYGGIRALAMRDPVLAAAQGFGAAAAFAPLIVCIAIGCLRRGAQRDVAPPSPEEGRPLR
jgi:hypothetical protein